MKVSDDSPTTGAGATKLHLQEWENLTSDPIILQNVAGVNLSFDSTPVQNSVPRQYKFNESQSEVIDQEISDLLEKDVIEVVNDTSDCFISNIFLWPKPGNKFRMIIDLSDLNKFVSKNHFKMDHLEVATQMLFPNAWLASIDLKEAYYAIPIAEEDQKYLCFQWGEQCFKFKCLPFGLCSAPWIFTKTLKPIFTKFHEAGFEGFGYIDDSFIIAESKEKCAQAVEFLSNLFSKLGFRINAEKSALDPCQELTFLGYLVNSKTMSVFPTEEKKEKVKKAVLNLLQDRKPKIRSVASTLGLLNDVCKGCEYGPNYLKRLEILKIKCLAKAGRRGFEARMKISWECKDDLKWWLQNVDRSSKRILIQNPALTLKTDASSLGWGAVLDQKTGGGRWSIEEATNHINILELKAIELGLKTLCSRVQHDSGIKILCDNTTSVAYLKHKGGTKSLECNTVARDIWKWCEERYVWLIVSHVPGVLNVRADFESRNFSEDTEWAINRDLFLEVCESWGFPCVDLFASRNNNQLPVYVSWGPDPGAQHVDAFTVDWSKYKFVYIFPPFRLLNRVLQKAKADRVKAMIVAPQWKGQPWFAPLTRASRDIKSFRRRANNLVRTETGTFEDKSLHDIPISFHLVW